MSGAARDQDVSAGAPPVAVPPQQVWRIIDWTVRCNAPRWLRTAGLHAPADDLAFTSPITHSDELSAVADRLNAAVLAANDELVRVWSRVVERAGIGAGPHATCQLRQRCWQAVTRNADLVMHEVTATTRAAEAALSASDTAGVSGIWRAGGAVVSEAAGARTWQCIDAVTSAPGWSWTTPAAAGAVTLHAARKAFRLIQVQTHLSLWKVQGRPTPLPVANDRGAKVDPPQPASVPGNCCLQAETTRAMPVPEVLVGRVP